MRRMVEKLCPACGRTFLTERKDKLYCSDQCRREEFVRRRRDRRRTINQSHLKGGTCLGCVDWEGDACEYLRNNGHCRPSKAEEPGGGCDLYSPVVRRRATEDERMGWDTHKAKKLLRDGLTAVEVADKLGCAPNSVKAWIAHGRAYTVEQRGRYPNENPKTRQG